jgi:8-oxo-dGTP pyrophosphatase MutT (NUDIX family)
MDFQAFLEYVPKILEATLPAKEAHYKLAPQYRIGDMERLELQSKNPKLAAVMMLFYPKNDATHLVLIVRNSYEGVHSAQIGFPGGKFEPKDKTYEITALRETFEEIGIHPESIEILRQFTRLYIPPSDFLVYPFFGICRNELLFRPDASEVAAVIEIPLAVFLDEEVMVNVQISTSYANYIMVPAFKIEEHIVWGATAMMLSELKDVLKKVL